MGDADGVPGSELVFTSPHKVSELLVVRVVMMLNAIQQRGRDLHQGVIGRLLLLSTRVAIIQVVNFVCDLCERTKY